MHFPRRSRLPLLPLVDPRTREAPALPTFPKTMMFGAYLALLLRAVGVPYRYAYSSVYPARPD